MKKYALIVAGGAGTRLGSKIPKQFLPLKGKPVLMHTIAAFFKAGVDQIIVVLPNNQTIFWELLTNQYSFTVPHTLVAGGETRFHSVRNGLEKVSNDGLVAIHDGVRPLVGVEIIKKSFETAAEKGNAITAVRLKDSIREVRLQETKNVNRSNFYLVQTPQTFQTNLIKEAYTQALHFNFTDDAGVLEEAGHNINLIEGSYQNIKITTSEDLLIAEALMAKM